MKTETKSREVIKATLEAMPVNYCDIKWDVMVWRVDGGYIVGRERIKRDGVIHTLDSAIEYLFDAR